MTRVYKFLSKNWAIDDIRKRRLRISEIHDLNDPFELIPFELSDATQLAQLSRARDEIGKRGVLCFSLSWSSPLLWAHYADKHRGICLGFDLPEEVVRQVQYVDVRLPFPTELNEEVAQQWIFTKFAAWRYEDEARVWASRDVEQDGHYFVNFDDSRMKLREIILGHRCCVERGSILALLGSYADEVAIIRARPSHVTFDVVAAEDGRST